MRFLKTPFHWRASAPLPFEMICSNLCKYVCLCVYEFESERQGMALECASGATYFSSPMAGTTATQHANRLHTAQCGWWLSSQTPAPTPENFGPSRLRCIWVLEQEAEDQDTPASLKANCNSVQTRATFWQQRPAVHMIEGKPLRTICQAIERKANRRKPTITSSRSQGTQELAYVFKYARRYRSQRKKHITQ